MPRLTIGYPLPVSYNISKSDNPELFEIIELCKKSDSEMIERLVAYAKKVCS